MSQLTGQDAAMQSRLNSAIVQFENQNERFSRLLLRLSEMRDSLAGDFRKEVAKPSDSNIIEKTSGIVPKIFDCLSEQDRQVERLSVILNDMGEYI